MGEFLTDLVRSETSASVCHIELNDGRDNRLSRSMCFELKQKLESAFAADDASLVLLTGHGDYFSAGYDLANLSSDADQLALFQLVDLLVQAPKPVIAGLQGHAFGAGLELALLCAFRLTTPEARFGFPDISHELPTGAGATQTLPRILGAERSLDLLLSGREVNAAELGAVIDAEIRGDFLTGTKRFAQSLAAQDLGPISIADRTEGFSDPIAYQSALVDAREGAGDDDDAGLDILNSVESALLLPFAAGIDVERETFKAAEARPRSRAQRHLVYQSWRLKESIQSQVARNSQLGRLAVIGDGEQSQICVARLLLAGQAVTLVHGDGVQSEDLRFDVLDTARQEAERQGQGDVHEARYSDQLTVSADLSDCATADLVLDASEDDMSVLQSRAQQLSALLPGHVVLVVACQQLGISPVEAAFARPAQFAKLWLEADLQQDTCVFSLSGEHHLSARGNVLELLQLLGLDGVETQSEAGTTTITLWLKLLQAAETLCLAGTPISAIDTALAEKGFGDGPFRMADELGLDMIDQLCADLPEFEASLSISRQLAENGHLGAETGAGYYLYEEGREGVPNPEATRIVQSMRQDRGQKVDVLEIQQYCLAVLANEAARLLADKVIRAPGQLDLLLTEEFGLSPDMGGPLHAADGESLLHLRYLLTGEDGRETPNYALLDLIKNGLNFSALNAEAQRFS